MQFASDSDGDGNTSREGDGRVTGGGGGSSGGHFSWVGDRRELCITGARHFRCNSG